MTSTRTAKKTTACLTVLETKSTGSAGALNTDPNGDMPWGFAGLLRTSYFSATDPNGDMPWG